MWLAPSMGVGERERERAEDQALCARGLPSVCCHTPGNPSQVIRESGIPCGCLVPGEKPYTPKLSNSRLADSLLGWTGLIQLSAAHNKGHVKASYCLSRWRFPYSPSQIQPYLPDSPHIFLFACSVISDSAAVHDDFTSSGKTGAADNILLLSGRTLSSPGEMQLDVGRGRC